MTITSALDLSAPRLAPPGQAAAARPATPGDRWSFSMEFGETRPEPAPSGAARTPTRDATGPRDGGAETESTRGPKPEQAEPADLAVEDSTTTETADAADAEGLPQMAEPLRAMLAPQAAVTPGPAPAISPAGSETAEAVPTEKTLPGFDETQTPGKAADAADRIAVMRANLVPDAAAMPDNPVVMPDADTETAKTHATAHPTLLPASGQGVEVAAAQAAATKAATPDRVTAAAKAQQVKATAPGEATATTMAADASGLGLPEEPQGGAPHAPLPKDGGPRVAEVNPRLVSHSEAPGAPGEAMASSPRRGAEDLVRIAAETPNMPRLSVEGPAPSATPVEARLLAEAAAGVLERAAHATAPTGGAPQAQAQAQTAAAAPLPATGLPPGQTPLLSLAGGDWPREMAAMLNEAGTLRRLGLGEALEIRLDPEALGQVNIRLEMREGAAHVAIVTQTPEAARLFTDNQQRLAEALARAGLELGSHSAGTGDGRGLGGEAADGRPRRSAPGSAVDNPHASADAQSDATGPTVAGTRRIDILA